MTTPSGDRPALTGDRLLMTGAAAPPAALAAVVSAMLIAASWGRHPFWQPSSLNLSEAAAARDAATVAVLIEAGEDPAARRLVRAPLLSEHAAVAATPLEAAVRTGRVEIVALLLERGVRIDGPTRAALACEALGRGYPDVQEYLAAPLAALECPSQE